MYLTFTPPELETRCDLRCGEGVIPMDNYKEVTISGETHLFTEDCSSKDILYARLVSVMETEAAALKGWITNKRRREAHRFILECFEKLEAIEERSERQTEAPDSDRR